MIQAVHLCKWVDKPCGEFFHTNWTGTGGRVASSTYTVCLRLGIPTECRERFRPRRHFTARRAKPPTLRNGTAD